MTSTNTDSSVAGSNPATAAAVESTSRPLEPKTRLLYIGGVGRSGSTLLERMIDQIPDYTAVGETHHLLQRGAQEDQVCGCGEPFSSCQFWSAVGERAFGGWDQVGIDAMVGYRDATDRTRLIPELLWSAKIGSDPARTIYVDFLERLYRAIQQVSTSTVIVDSSKNLSTACVLHNLHDVDLRIVHLIRDSRGVAYSWTKKVVRPEVKTGTALMPQYHPIKPASRWLTDNLGFSLLPIKGIPVLTVRYEDLLDRPDSVLTDVHRFAGFTEPPDLDFIVGRTADLRHPTHSVSGNPMRFDEGPTELRPDDAWTTSLPRSQASVVSMITAPLLMRYGYAGPRRNKNRVHQDRIPRNHDRSKK